MIALAPLSVPDRIHDPGDGPQPRSRIGFGPPACLSSAAGWVHARRAPVRREGVSPPSLPPSFPQNNRSTTARSSRPGARHPDSPSRSKRPPMGPTGNARRPGARGTQRRNLRCSARGQGHPVTQAWAARQGWPRAALRAATEGFISRLGAASRKTKAAVARRRPPLGVARDQ